MLGQFLNMDTSKKSLLEQQMDEFEAEFSKDYPELDKQQDEELRRLTKADFPDEFKELYPAENSGKPEKNSSSN